MTEQRTPDVDRVDFDRVDVDTVDFLTDTTIVDDPYPYYRHVRDTHGPVWIEPTWGVAMVTGHAEAMTVYRDPATFSSCNAATGPFPGLPERPAGDDADELIERHRPQMPLYGYMATWDPPEHQAYRSLLTGLFTPKRLKENEAFMWRLADQELDRFLDHGRCEFIREYSSPFALLVIADLLGVPHEDLPRFRQWFRQTAGRGFGGLDEDSLEQRRGEVEEVNILGFFEAAFSAYIEDRRTTPRGDVLTHLAGVTFPDGSVPDTTVLANEAAFLFAAGQETTARSMAFAMQRIAEDDALQATLRARHDLLPALTEEVLRLESPVKSHFRMARRTTTLAGVTIPAGTSVMLMIGAVNRDPLVYEAPDEIRLDRPNLYEHIAFVKGPHSCLGQQLARAEMRVSFERILDRMSDIHLDEARHGPEGDRRFAHDPSSLFRGLSRLHVEFTPVP